MTAPIGFLLFRLEPFVALQNVLDILDNLERDFALAVIEMSAASNFIHRSSTHLNDGNEMRRAGSRARTVRGE